MSRLNVKQIVMTAALSALTGFLVMEILKRVLKRDDVQIRPSPPNLSGMPGGEMSSAHWNRY